MKVKCKSKWLSLTAAAFFTMALLSPFSVGNVHASSNGQEILITEVMPLSQLNDDSYEYIELYNNSDKTIDLKDYKLPLQNIDINFSKTIQPKGTLVLCSKASTTLEQFNTFYGTKLTAEKYAVLPCVNEILSNNAPGSIILAKDDSTLIVRAQYNLEDFQAKKSVTFKYADGVLDMVRIGQNQNPTPGEIAVDQVPNIIRVTGVTLDKTVLTMDIKHTAVLQATVSPATSTNRSVIWSSDTMSVVQVDQEGVLTPKSTGSANITVTTVDGLYKASCRVTVVNDMNSLIPVTGIDISKNIVLMNKGEDINVTAAVSPANATNKTIIWTTNNASVALVTDSGKITAISRGIAIITARTADGGFKDRCFVLVRSNEDTSSIVNIRLNKNSIRISEGKFEKLTPIISPEYMKNANLIWKSNNEKVAYVTDSGVVWGRSKGEAEITVSTKDGKHSAKCKVQVIDEKNSDNGKGKGLSK